MTDPASISPRCRPWSTASHERANATTRSAFELTGVQLVISMRSGLRIWAEVVERAGPEFVRVALWGCRGEPAVIRLDDVGSATASECTHAQFVAISKRQREAFAGGFHEVL